MAQFHDVVASADLRMALGVLLRSAGKGGERPFSHGRQIFIQPPSGEAVSRIGYGELLGVLLEDWSTTLAHCLAGQDPEGNSSLIA